MKNAAAASVDLSIRSVLHDTWKLYKRLFLKTVLTGFVVFVLIRFLSALLYSGHAGSGGLLVALLSFAASLVGTALVQGALVEAVRDVHEGDCERSVAQLYERAAPRLGALVGVSVLAGLGIGLGLLLLVVPGVVLATRWALAVPVVMLEGASPRRALARSRELVRGHGRAVFRVLLNVSVLTGLLTLVFNRIGYASGSFLSLWVSGTLAGALVTPYAAHALTVVYYRLTDPGEPLVPAPARWATIWDEQEDQA